MERLESIISLLIDLNYFTEEELSLVTSINGYNEDAINDAIYVRTGFHDINQLFSEDNQVLKDYNIIEEDEDIEEEDEDIEEEDEDGKESPESTVK
jgi:hypothetical protein